jgi:integrase
MAAMNHPKKGDIIKVEPIRTIKDIKAIKRLLADKPRDSAMFTLGVNTNLRASDLLKITVGMVRNLKPEEHFTVRETKTDKDRNITINQTVYRSIQNLLATMPDVDDEELLFQSRKGKLRKTVPKNGGEMRQPSEREISVPTLNGMVKGWCKEINLLGNYGSHTLRKTFGYMHRTVNKTDLPTLMTMFNHSSQKQTLEYLCIQPEEIKSAYLFEL